MAKYVIEKNGNEYYKTEFSGKQKWTTSKFLADTFSDYNRVKNLVDKALSRAPGDTFKIIDVEAKPNSKVKDPKKNTLESVKKEAAELKKELGDYDDLYEEITKTNEKNLKELESRRDKLREKLSELDKMQCDVLHYIENKKLDVHRAWLVYLKLRNIRLRRRKVKNELKSLNMYLDGNKNALKKIKENINGCKDRKYTPRVLFDLFESDNVE